MQEHSAGRPCTGPAADSPEGQAGQGGVAARRAAVDAQSGRVHLARLDQVPGCTQTAGAANLGQPHGLK